ncbi:MAG: capping complex subunit for YIEGIA [Bacillus sp. (in: firmicutes)]
MVIEKYILAVITSDKEKVPIAPAVFYCDTIKEMNDFCINLEAILDGIAHKLSDEVYIIVKH